MYIELPKEKAGGKGACGLLKRLFQVPVGVSFLQQVIDVYYYLRRDSIEPLW